ncbi:hypothetical protein GIB67_025711 [Kingdonia uniflora]|uniref:Uncharacterized protein n=1 Tax=Kingdonia uniflora TaxID=39325 RepID=A0A7J7KW67_9MAGN|nr:hypothetical protein GIB67_025711 [Kingdonia uniflora]
MEIGRTNMFKNERSCNDGNVVLLKRYKASDMKSEKDASVLESRTVRARSNKCQPLERERINSSSSSPIKRFTTSKNLESTQRERQKIRGFDKELFEGDKRLKRAKDYGSHRCLYSSVVREKLDATADSHSDTEGVKYKVERKESLLDEVAEEETELELVLEGLSLSRKKRVDSRSNKVRKAQSSRSMAGVDEGKRQVSGEEARANFSKTPRTGRSVQPNPAKPCKIALKYPKKRMLKALPTSGTTRSGKVAKDKRRRVKPSGESGEMVVERQSTAVDDLKEVEERAKLAVLHGEENTSKMVARLVKGIWLGIEEEKSELKKANVELEKELARSRTDALKEARQLKASHTVAIGQLQVETKANLDEIVEERDRLGHHLMLKGYSEEEVDAIKADTYVEKEDEEEAEAVGIVDGLDGVSRQTVLKNQGDDVELPEGGSEKVKEKDSEIKKGLKELSEVTECAEKLQSLVDALAMKGKQADTAQYRIQALEQSEEQFRSDLQRCRNELERMRQKFIEKDDELRVAQENLSASEAAAEYLQIALPAKDMEFWEMQRRCNNLNERVVRLKAELAQAIARAKKVEARNKIYILVLVPI